ncbi:hypothetical protein [Oceanicaulis sp.]|uniref:hypothetical protein n=1 Tax=Oceanicaulis sp. TaxID=1924941 RepID=UPI003F72DA5E
MDYDRDRYDAWTWKHPLILHWVLNPGLAINELVLGQRIPRLTLIDTQSEAPLVDRQYIPCPHCQALNPAVVYKNARFGNYAGLVCPECGEEIPTVKNALTWLLLMISWPLWAPFKRRVAPAMLAKQRAKMLHQTPDDARAPSQSKVSGLKLGAFFGLFMGLFFFATAMLGGGGFGAALTSSAIGGALGGVFFGVTMKLFLTVAGRRAAPETPSQH